MPKHLPQILLALIIQNRIRIRCSKECLKNLLRFSTEVITTLEHHEKLIFLFRFTLFRFSYSFSRLLFLPLRLDHARSFVLFLHYCLLLGFFFLCFLFLFWVSFFPFPLLLDLGGCFILLLSYFLFLPFPLLLNCRSSLILFLLFLLPSLSLFLLPLTLDHCCGLVLLFVNSLFSTPPFTLYFLCCEGFFLALFKVGVAIESLSITLLNYGSRLVLFFLHLGNLDLLFSFPLFLNQRGSFILLLL